MGEMIFTDHGTIGLTECSYENNKYTVLNVGTDLLALTGISYDVAGSETITVFNGSQLVITSDGTGYIEITTIDKHGDRKTALHTSGLSSQPLIYYLYDNTYTRCSPTIQATQIYVGFQYTPAVIYGYDNIWDPWFDTNTFLAGVAVGRQLKGWSVLKPSERYLPVNRGLLFWYDGINNMGYGHSDSLNTWRDLSGNESPAWYSGGSWGKKHFQGNGNDGILCTNQVAQNVMTHYLIFGPSSLQHNDRDALYSNIERLGMDVRQLADDPGKYNVAVQGWDGSTIYTAFSKSYTLKPINYLTIVTNGTTIKVYIDGVLADQQVLTTTILSDAEFVLGAHADIVDGQTVPRTTESPWPWSGKVYCARAHSVEHTAAEISENYQYDHARYLEA